MPTGDENFSSIGLDALIAGRRFQRDSATGIVNDPLGHRTVLAGPGFIQSLHLILDRERRGAWSAMLKPAGHTCGRKFAAEIDGRLLQLGKPVLADLPLEGCLVFVERYFSVHGLGVLRLDLRLAPDQGIVVAHLDNSFFAKVLEGVDGCVDAMAAGLLQGFFEHISGQGLGCEEIACLCSGASHCTFVLTARDRLAAISSFIGREDADAIVARLCA